MNRFFAVLFAAALALAPSAATAASEEEDGAEPVKLLRTAESVAAAHQPSPKSLRRPRCTLSTPVASHGDRPARLTPAPFRLLGNPPLHC